MGAGDSKKWGPAVYINRLSELLFVCARFCAHKDGYGDLLAKHEIEKRDGQQ
jgi:cob(I)alamin adenosyltransferase